MKRVIFLLLIFISFSIRASALNISYETVIGIKGKSVLIEKFQIEKKTNYLCNLDTYACEATKLKKLPSVGTNTKNSYTSTLKSTGATHITMSPLSDYVAYYLHNNTNQTRKLVLKNVKRDTEKYQLNNLNYWDLLNDQDSVYSFTPDGSKLIYLDDNGGNFSLYKIDTSNFDSHPFPGTLLETNTLEIHQFMAYDNETIFYVGNTKTKPYNWNLYKYDLNTGTQKNIMEDVSYTSTLRKMDNKLVFAKQEYSGYGPRVYDIKNNKIHFFDLPNINRNVSKSSESTAIIGDRYGVIMNPTTSAQTAVIWLHGGPYRQTSYGYHPYHSYGTYDSILNAMREQGVLILKLDYSGSLGFGKEYSESIDNNVGTKDVSDVTLAIKYLKANYGVKNVYLIGNSYGGYLSLKTTVDNSSEISGAISINGVTDWESLLSYMGNSIFNAHFDGAPNILNKRFYNKASIIKNLKNLENSKPIMIIQAEKDHTVAPWQATLLSDAMKKEKKNVTLATYPKEDHVWIYEKNIRDMCKRIFKFVDIKNNLSCIN